MQAEEGEASIDSTKVYWLHHLWTSVEEHDDALPWVRKYGPQEDVDISMAREMNSLSIAKSECLYEDIHGVSRVIEETPELVNAALAALEQEISRIGQKQKLAYEQALFMNPI